MCVPRPSGRRTAFKSVEERDRHLKAQVSEISKSVADREALIKKNQSERERHLKTIEMDKAAIQTKNEEIAEKQAAVALLGEDETKMTYLRNEKLDEKKVGCYTRPLFSLSSL
jgi:chromosome segregation ATPase